MKKKEKKYYGKKKKFYSFFLKIFIPFIIVTAILGGVITVFLRLSFMRTIENNNLEAHNSLQNAGTRLWDTYKNELAEQKDADYDFQTPYNHYIENVLYRNAISMAALNDSETVSMQGFIHLYQKDASGSLVELAEQKAVVFLQVNDKSGEKYMLSCDKEMYEAAIPEMKLMAQDFILESIDEIYVSGTQFYVGAYTYDIDGQKHKKTVSGIPDGYVKLDQSLGFTIPHGVIGTVEDSMSVDRYTGTREILKEFQNGTDWEVIDETEKCQYGTHVVNSFTINSDNTTLAIVDCHYNMMKSMTGHLLIWTWLGVVFGSALISLLIAYVMYRSYRSAYDMEQYRRTTSNSMAHDLKSPLAVISLYAENLQSGKNPEKNQYYINGILNEVKAMNEQVASILDMAKAEDINTELHKTTVDIAAIVKTAADVYAETIRNKHVQLDVQGSSQIEADETLMVQAVMNIMDNAVKYVAENGTITVRMSNDSLEISNTSEPLSDEILKKIWSPFVKGDNSRHGHKGTGLGLSIVKTIMDRHGFICEMKNTDDGVEVKVDFR